MVLYEAVSTYHLLCALVDQLNHKQQNSVLLIAKPLKEKYDVWFLKKYFDDIKIYDINYAIQVNLDKNKIKKYFCELLGIDDIQNSGYETIYCSCGHHSFGYFLEVFQIPHVFCEDGAGILSRPQILIDINDKIKMRNKFNLECIRLGGYDGSNPCVLKKRCNYHAQTENFYDEKAIHFDVLEELNKLENKEIDNIIRFFFDGKGNIDIDNYEYATLILAQHFNNLGVMGFEDQILIYQILIDYFFSEDKIIIKSHPSDIMYYRQLFSPNLVVSEKFPSELMPFVFNKPLNCIATISSTAIFNLRGHYPKIFELDSRYEKDFPMTHRYYVALCIAKELRKNIYCKGTNELLLKRLADTLDMGNLLINDKENDVEKPYIFIVDDVVQEGEDGRKGIISVLDSLDASSAAILINSKADYCWYDYYRRDIWNNIVPVVLEKSINEPKSEDFYASMEDEVIYVYSKNKEILRMARNTIVDKKLKYTGITINNAMLTPEQEKIKMLEGILEATEKRLLYYIEKDKLNLEKRD